MAAPGLAERTFLLTAATGDIAKALAHYAAAQGARLILQARPEAADALTAWAATLRNDGHSVETVSRTLQSAADAKALVTHAETHFGRIHAACLFTAQPPPASLLYCEEAALTAALGEVQAATVLLQALAQHWRGRGEHGALVLSAGTDAFFPSTQRAAAAMQQAALIALARTAALEWRRQGIRVNALVPTAREAGTQEAPLFRAADSGALTPAQVAPVAAFLLSEPSTAISGEVVGIAGNRLYRLHHAQSPGLFSEAATWHPDDIAAQWLALSRQRGT